MSLFISASRRRSLVSAATKILEQWRDCEHAEFIHLQKSYLYSEPLANRTNLKEMLRTERTLNPKRDAAGAMIALANRTSLSLAERP